MSPDDAAALAIIVLACALLLLRATMIGVVRSSDRVADEIAKLRELAERGRR